MDGFIIAALMLVFTLLLAGSATGEGGDDE